MYDEEEQQMMMDDEERQLYEELKKDAAWSEFEQQNNEDDISQRQIQTSMMKRDTLGEQFENRRKQKEDELESKRKTKREQIIDILKNDKDNIDDAMNVIDESVMSDDIVETVSNRQSYHESESTDNQFKRRRSLTDKQMQ